MNSFCSIVSMYQTGFDLKGTSLSPFLMEGEAYIVTETVIFKFTFVITTNWWIKV